MADPAPTSKANSPVGDLVSQILDLFHGAQGRDINRGNTAADIADPFRGQRGNYTDQLLELVKNPPKYDGGVYHESPGYKFGLEQGLEGVNRAGNAMFGTTRSGNTAIELEKYATGFAQNDYDKWRTNNTQREDLFNRKQDQQRNNLALLAGATTGSPAAASEQYMRGYANNNRTTAGGLSGLDSLLNLAGQGGSALAKFLQGALSGGAGSVEGGLDGVNLQGSVDEFA